MEKKTERRGQGEVPRGYDLKQLKGGVRGKYARRYRARTNLVLLSPGVAECFPDEQPMNRARRRLIEEGNRPLRRAR